MVEMPLPSSQNIGNGGYNNGFKENDRRELEYLEEKLRSEKKMFEQKTRLLDRKELDLEERER